MDACDATYQHFNGLSGSLTSNNKEQLSYQLIDEVRFLK